MSLQPREKRVVIFGAVALAGILLYRISSSAPESHTVLAAPETVAGAEKRLTKLRQMSALVPGKQDALNKVQAELAAREKGILQADTPQQAQAQLFQIM